MKLSQRRAHVRKLRRTVITIAITLFVAVWAVIFTALVTGHDPVLIAKAQTVATSSTGSTSSTSASTGSASTGSGATGSGTTTTVTTSQS